MQSATPNAVWKKIIEHIRHSDLLQEVNLSMVENPRLTSVG